MVWRPERPAADQSANWRRAGYGGDDRGHVGLFVVQGRKETGHGPGEKRFARTWGADHDQAMPAGESQLQSSPSLDLPAHLGQIGSAASACDSRPGDLRVIADLGRHLDSRRPAASSPKLALADEQRGLRQGRSRNDVYSIREARFIRAFDRNHDPRDAAAGKSRHHRQKARDGAHLASKGQLPQERPAAACVHLLGSDQNAKRDGKVQRGAALAHVRRCQIDRDPPRRVFVAAVPDGAPNPLAGFLQGCVRKPDDREPGQTRCHVHLDPNRAAIQTVQGGREKRCEHDATLGHADLLGLIRRLAAWRKGQPGPDHRSYLTSAGRCPRSFSRALTKSRMLRPRAESAFVYMNGAPLFRAPIAERYSFTIW